MSKTWKPVLVLLTVLLPSAVLAQGYAGLNYVGITYADDDLQAGNEEIELGDLMARLGGNIAPWWLMELRLGSTVAKYEENETSYKHRYFYSVMARFQYPLPRITPYVAAGMTWFETRGSGGYEGSFDDSTWAAGLDIKLSGNLGLNLEYAQLFNEGGITGEAPSAGIFYAF